MPGPQRTIQRRSPRPEDRQHDGRRNEKWRQVHDALKRRMPCVRREYHVISRPNKLQGFEAHKAAAG